MPQPKKAKAAGGGSERRAPEPSPDISSQLDALENTIATGDTESAALLVEALLQAGPAVARACERRLHTSMPPFSDLLLDLIQSLDTSPSLQSLDRIAENRGLDDRTRLAARRMAGWATGDVAFQRMAFLATLRDADATLSETIAQRYPQTESAETVEDALRYLQAMPAQHARALVARMAEDLQDRFVLPAHTFLHIDDPELQRQVVTWLFVNSDDISSPALNRLARTATDPAIRELAREVATKVAARPSSMERRQDTAPTEILLSGVEGQGQQTIYFSRYHRPDIVLVVEFAVNDTAGVFDLSGQSHTSADYLDMIRKDYAVDEQPLVRITRDEARGLLEFGMRVNERSGHPLPSSYEIWEAYLHEQLPQVPSEPVTIPELEDAPYTGRDDLVNDSPALLEHPAFMDWAFPPMDTLGAMTLADEPTSKGIGNAQYEPVIDALVYPQRRQLIRSRLRRQAWVLDRAGMERERDLSLAVSASLRSIGLVDLVSHPFLRAMVDKSVATAIGQSALERFDSETGSPLPFGDIDDEGWDDEDWDNLLEDLVEEPPER